MDSLFVHDITGRYLELAPDGTVLLWRDGTPVRTQESREAVLRRVVPTPEQWLGKALPA